MTPAPLLEPLPLSSFELLASFELPVKQTSTTSLLFVFHIATRRSLRIAGLSSAKLANLTAICRPSHAAVTLVFRHYIGPHMQL